MLISMGLNLLLFLSTLLISVIFANELTGPNPPNPQECTSPPDVDFEEDRSLRKTVAILVPILFGIAGGVGLVGNVFVLITVLGKRLQYAGSSTNILIANLAFTNLLFIIFCIPFTAMDYVSRTWPLGLTWCKIVQYLIYVCAYTTAYNIVLMSMDQFIEVLFPVSHRRLGTLRNACIAVAVLWTITLLANIPIIHIHEVMKFASPHDCHQSSHCMFHFYRHDEIAFRWAFFATLFVIPSCLMYPLYITALVGVWCASSTSYYSRHNEERRFKKLLTTATLIVAVGFTVCWGPLTLILALRASDWYPIDVNSITIQIAAHVLAYSNVCIIPIIFAAIHPGFQRNFWNLIRCRRTSRLTVTGVDNDYPMVNKPHVTFSPIPRNV